MGMPETLYGWYPPARSKWSKPTKPGLPYGYEADCLYKHWKSRYNGSEAGIPTPEPPSAIRRASAQSYRSDQQGSSRMSQHHSKTSSSRAESCVSKTSTRTPSVKVPKFSATPTPVFPESPGPFITSRSKDSNNKISSQRGTPTSRPSRAWAMHTDATPIVTPTPAPASVPVKIQGGSRTATASSRRGGVKISTERKNEVVDLHRNTTPTPQTARPYSSSTNGNQKPRIHSAPSSRPTSKRIPQRTIKSAGPIRSAELSCASKEMRVDLLADSPVRQIGEMPIGITEGERAKDSPIEQISHTGARTPEMTADRINTPVLPTTADCFKVLDYDTELKKHGWKLEIPGDPLGLKTPCIAPRLAFTKTIPIPSVAPNPPTGHMQVFDTYFYNTIPRKPMSFTIHPEWVSEVLHAKRLQLQKKEGLNFKHTNYSFAY